MAIIMASRWVIDAIQLQLTVIQNFNFSLSILKPIESSTASCMNQFTVAKWNWKMLLCENFRFFFHSLHIYMYVQVVPIVHHQMQVFFFFFFFFSTLTTSNLHRFLFDELLLSLKIIKIPPMMVRWRNWVNFEEVTRIVVYVTSIYNFFTRHATLKNLNQFSQLLLCNDRIFLHLFLALPNHITKYYHSERN